MARFDRRRIYPEPDRLATVAALFAIVPIRVNGVIKQRGRVKQFRSVNRIMQFMGGGSQWVLPFTRFNRGGTSKSFGRTTFSRTALDLFETFPNALTAQEKQAIGAFVDLESLSGNYQLMDSFASFRLYDEANALWDWKQLKSMTAIDNPTHIPGNGFDLNGTSQYIQTNLNPTTDVTNFTLDDAMAGVEMLDVYPRLVDANFRTLFHLRVGNPGISLRFRSGTMFPNMNDSHGASLFTNLPHPVGKYIVSRPNSTDNQIYYNGVLIKASTGIFTSSAIPDGIIMVGARNESEVYSEFFEGKVGNFILGSNNTFIHPLYNRNLNVFNGLLTQTL